MADPLREAMNRFERMSERARCFWREQAADAREARDRQEWKLLGYKTLDDYFEAVCGQGKTQLYKGIRALEELSSLPTEVVEKMSLESASLLGKMPEKERDADTVRAACEQTDREFSTTVRNTKAHLHIDQSQPITFKLHETAIEVIEGAIEKAMQVYGLTAKGAALERICEEWKQGDVSIEQHEAVRKLAVAIDDSLIVGQALPEPKAMAKIWQLCSRMQKVFHLTPREIAIPPSTKVDMTQAGKQPRVN